MRIIAGQWRGRTIAAPAGDQTRPILDRAKTVLFDVLGSRLAEPGRLPDVAVLDLFGGSGAMGLEALSRGARYCLFFERHRASAAVLRRNLDTLHIVHEAKLSEADGTRAEWPPPPADEDQSPTYGLVFVDPPYQMLSSRVPDPAIRALLKRLDSDPAISPIALIVVRHERTEPGAEPDLAPLVEAERREVGTMTIRFLHRSDHPGERHAP